MTAAGLACADLVVFAVARPTTIPGDLFQFFGLEFERNLPTWFASSLLLLASLSAAHIGQLVRAAGDRRARTWIALAGLLAFLSLDETAAIHERLNAPIRDAWHLSGPLLWGWVLPGVGAVLVVGLVFLRFVRSLPSATRAAVVVAAALYVIGGLGMELTGAARFSQYRWRGDIIYQLLVFGEEGLEMAGVIVLLYGLASYRTLIDPPS